MAGNSTRFYKVVAIAAVCVSAVLCLCFTSLAQEINVVINGHAVIFSGDSGYPFIDRNGRTMVPLRVTMESAGFAVGYDSVKQTAIVITDRSRIEVPIGTDYIYCNNILIPNDTFSVVRDGRVYLPIRIVLEAVYYTVEWDAMTFSVVAYNFLIDDYTFVPYSTSSPATLIEAVRKGNVVYINGRYYATPEYMRMLTNAKVHYLGDDLNTAIYPEKDRFWFSEVEIIYPD